VIAIALAAELGKVGISMNLAGSIAFNFTEGNPHDRPLLEGSEMPFLILYPQTQSFRFVFLPDPAFSEALNFLGTPVSFAAINVAGVIQGVTERLARRGDVRMTEGRASRKSRLRRA
jgi:hypothetical protein